MANFLKNDIRMQPEISETISEDVFAMENQASTRVPGILRISRTFYDVKQLNHTRVANLQMIPLINQ
jgi:hypothetical protein